MKRVILHILEGKKSELTLTEDQKSELTQIE